MTRREFITVSAAAAAGTGGAGNSGSSTPRSANTVS